MSGTIIYQFDGYKEFINQRLSLLANNGRGARAHLARHIGCQVAYISLVLSGDRHFNPDQLLAAGEFLGLREEELEFLVYLLERDRSGTSRAKSYFEKLIKQKRAHFTEMRERVHIQERLSVTHQALYYSSSAYSLIHMLLTLPDFSKAEAIAVKLNLKVQTVITIITDLIQMGLVKNHKDGYKVLKEQLFLPKGSPFLNILHRNSRDLALKNFVQSPQSESLHLSLSYSLSKKDMKVIHQKMATMIEEVTQIVKDSPAEEIACFNLDFFSPEHL